MTRILKKIKTLCVRAKNAVNNFCIRSKYVVANNRAEGSVDTGVKILISVVVGALVLAGLVTLFGETIFPTLTQKIKDLFDYKG